ncbi:MAG: ATP-dependent zinc metalloprotease FtsH [Clostridia bacterium]|nr:ATP-dependent zinc metalloprotease FtsH [Clostridia bacterium]
MKQNGKVALFYLVLLIGILFISSTLFGSMKPEEIKHSDIVAYFHDEKVESFVITPQNEITLVLKDGAEVKYELRDLGLFWTQLGDLIDEQQEKGILKTYDLERAQETPWWLAFLPYVIVLAAIIGFWVYMMRQMGGGKGGKMNSFGRSRAKLNTNEKKKVYFSDVAGADEEKEELQEVVEFLKNPAKFKEVGARIPRGMLLVGPPGTGKTLLAKAVAGEAGVNFYSISGSDFVEMYVGVGASRVRDLFETAKKNAPCIIFIDEIDAVGRHRGAGLGGGHDEREQTLNQLLVEMDGFETSDGVIIMAATNRPDILDPALLRPGRFDRQITVNYPDIRGRHEILKVHAKGKPLEETVDLEDIAKGTIGFTGADLANLLNEAALLAARRSKKLIGMTELEDAKMRIVVGPQKKSRVITEKDRRLTAFHEAGHAIATHYLETQDPVYQISIIPAGRAGGYTLHQPQEDRSYSTKREMEENIVVLLGGRMAEKLVLSDISTGASNDIERASEIARKMITSYGMSEKLGPIVYGTGHTEVFLGRDFNQQRNYSEKIAGLIDDEVLSVIDEAYRKAEQILTEHMDQLQFVAGYLLKHEMMDEEQFAAAMKEGATEADLDAIRIAKEEKSAEENKSRAASNAAARQSKKEKASEKNKEEENPADPLHEGEDPFKKPSDEDDTNE